LLYQSRTVIFRNNCSLAEHRWLSREFFDGDP
jgi:hypothetical protein